MSYRIGIDVGGTFTDIVIADDEGTVVREKVPTTPDDFAAGVLNGIEQELDEHEIGADAVRIVSHGTTIATNALIERTGAETALITTAGFEDILAIGREKRSNTYDHSPSKLPPFIERRHRYGVTERLSAEGDVQTPLDESEVRGIIESLPESVESVCVSLLHAYRNDAHERRIAELIERETDLPVSRSSVVMSEIQEYERTLSTALDAYVAPLIGSYVERLETGLADIGIDAPLRLMGANGGVMSPKVADQHSLRLVNSGPAAGVIGTARMAGEAGISNVITLDMGGTSADACLINEGAPEMTTEGSIEEIPLLFPQVDVRAVGAGGGSIVWTDPGGALKVGPKSAGADPGPACYGRGGTEATVTDAALLLGYIDPEYFLGGTMELDVGAAEAAIDSIANEVDTPRLRLAEGVLDIAATNMTGAIRLVTVENGYDPREFALACYGGAGPLFATRLARKLDIDHVFVPTAPGVLSAAGLLVADARFDFSVSHPLTLASEHVDVISGIFDDLSRQAERTVDGAYEVERSVDVRYSGQTFELSVEIPEEIITEEAIARCRERFIERYESIYGESNPEGTIEAVTWRLQASQPSDGDAVTTPSKEGTIAAARKGTREVYDAGESVRYEIYDRRKLPPDVSFDGPAIIEDPESSTVAGSEATVEIDDRNNIHIRP